MNSRPLLALLLAASLPVLAAAPADRGQAPDAADKPLLAAPASSLPDLARGQRAASEGRTADAERDLLPLAERGYPEARYALAKLYGRLDTAPAAALAIRWYRSVLNDKPDVALPLARLLLREPTPVALGEAESLLSKAWSQRSEIEALAGLIRLYSEHPELDRKQALAGLAARAEKLDRAETNLALIHWYRATPELSSKLGGKLLSHPERLVALCRKSLDLAPECYVDLLDAARGKGDRAQIRTLAAALLSQYGSGRVSDQVAASAVRMLLSDADGALDEELAPKVSDLPEDDNPLPPSPAQTAVAASQQACAAAPVGLNKAAPPAATAKPAAAAEVAAKASQALGAEPELAEPILRRLLAGAVPAQLLAASLIVRYPYLAPDVDVEPLLKAGVAQHLPQAPLYLGQLYLEGQRAPRDPAAALAALQTAAAEPETAVAADFNLGRLYQAGYLDEVDPAQARDHLLRAARAGHRAADSALARLYASGKGICPNLGYARLFARLGAEGGAATIRQLLAVLEQAMSPEQLQASDRLLREELAARPGRTAPSTATTGTSS
jgi:TPR repeat protein